MVWYVVDVLVALAASGQVYIPYCEWGDELLNQLIKFVPNTNYKDDKVDVAGLFGRILESSFAPTEMKVIDTPEKDEYGFDDEVGEQWRMM